MESNNRELLLKLTGKVFDVQEQTEHYASVGFSNYGWDVLVCVKKGGFHAGFGFDFYSGFRREETEAIYDALNYLDELLGKKSAGRG